MIQIDNKTITINIASEFTETPGPREKKDGPFSGELFREQFLEKYFLKDDDTKIIIDLDGVKGYAPSFLEEAFGGLVRKYGREKVLNKIEIRAIEKAYYRDLSYRYIKNAEITSKR